MRSAILLALVGLLVPMVMGFNRQERVILRLALKIRQTTQLLEECMAKQSQSQEVSTPGSTGETTASSLEVDSGSEESGGMSYDVMRRSFGNLRHVRAVLDEYKRDRSSSRFERMVRQMQAKLGEVREELRDCLEA